MDYRLVNIHTHRRTGEGIEVMAVMAGTTGAVGTARSDRVEPSLPEPPFSIGIHPWQLGGPVSGDKGLAGDGLEEALREVETAPASAIGEIGFDFAPAVTSGRALQKTVFEAQLRIAEERELPVVLHCVRAFEPTMEILSAFRLPAVVFHGFVGSREQAIRAVKGGYLLSFGPRSLGLHGIDRGRGDLRDLGGSCSPGSQKTIEAMREIPVTQLFLETDDDPVSIAEMYARAAEILGLPIPKLAEQLYDNYIKMFVK